MGGEQGSKEHLAKRRGGCGGEERDGEGGEGISRGRERGVPVMEEIPGLPVRPEKGSLEKWGDPRA